jgi:hypothetical protein
MTRNTYRGSCGGYCTSLLGQTRSIQYARLRRRRLGALPAFVTFNWTLRHATKLHRLIYTLPQHYYIVLACPTVLLQYYTCGYRT